MNPLDAPVTFEYFGKETALSLREYLQLLLTDLWERGWQFDGKRPFGFSGWKSDVRVALVRSGHVKGKLDENGYLQQMSDEECDHAHALVHGLIREVFQDG
jgi:hypothetical protein